MIRKYLVYISQQLGLYSWVVKQDTRRREHKLKKAFDKYGLEALQQADKAFRSEGSFIFPTFGTLLGAYREKGFIPHDNDLDVGFLYEQRPHDVPGLLSKFGFQHEKQLYIKENNKVIEDVYSYKGVQIDFFTYFTTDEDMYCYITRRHEYKDWRKANETDGFPTELSWVNKTGFSEQSFLGLTLYMPDQTHQWLEDIFGASFMTPIKNWTAQNYVTRIKHHTERTYRKYFK